MEERLKSIPNRLLTFWNKYTAKQKATIISVSAIIIFALIILGFVLTRPKMVTLITCESTKEAAEVRNILENEGISMNVSDSGLVISVNKKDIANATIALGENSIPADGYGIDEALSGGFSTTEADKEKRYKLYLESKLEDTLKTMEGVKDASVSLSIPDDDGTIISQEQDTYASVLLTLDGTLPDDAPNVMAKYVATAVGNKTTDSVVVIDSNGNLLFSGEDNTTTVGNASNQFAVKNQAEALLKKTVKDVMLGTNVYDNIEVAPNLDINFDVINQTDHSYSPAEGQDQGLLSHEEVYEAETNGGDIGGEPGTDSNANTTYVMPDGTTTSSTTTQTSRDYTPNERITDTQFAPGSVDYDNSSISIVATNYVVYKEDDLRAQGLLDGTTFAEYTAANDVRTKTTVDQDFYTMVSRATGISPDNISIVAYDVPFFQESDGNARTWTDYLMIAMIVLILGLLGFVIFKSTRPIEVLETEPELSVEALLASTKEASPLDDIDFNEKSEARKLIEKFVDENPAAVAQLLRNWLNEDWE